MSRERARFWMFAIILMAAGLILDQPLAVAIIANVAALLLYETGELNAEGAPAGSASA